jgi:osmotically inducible protein OsmC
MNRTASAIWSGGIKDGKGTLSTQSNALSNTPYSFSARFEEGAGTNPEELVAAAHAGCFTMDLSGRLARANMVAERIQTTATVSLDKGEKGFSVTASHLDVVAKIPNADEAAFQDAVTKAKEGCPISRLLNANITVSARLE